MEIANITCYNTKQNIPSLIIVCKQLYLDIEEESYDISHYKTSFSSYILHYKLFWNFKMMCYYVLRQGFFALIVKLATFMENSYLVVKMELLCILWKIFF